MTRKQGLDPSNYTIWNSAERPQKIITALNIIQDIILKDHIFFMGGGHRFGWATSNSDLDLFIYEDKPTVPHTDIEHYYNNGEPYPSDSISSVARLIYSESRYPGQHWNTNIFNVSVDLLIFYDFDEYNNLYNEHNIIEKLLVNNPVLQQYLKFSEGIAGKSKYKVLKKLLVVEGLIKKG